MNLRWMTIAILLTSNAAFASESAVQFTKNDFSHAEEVRKGNQSLLRLDLSPMGKDHAREFKPGEKVRFAIGNQQDALTFRAPITGSQLEAGPFSHQEAVQIVHEINDY